MERKSGTVPLVERRVSSVNRRWFRWFWHPLCMNGDKDPLHVACRIWLERELVTSKKR